MTDTMTWLNGSMCTLFYLCHRCH